MDAKSYMTDVFDHIKLDDGMNLAYPEGWILQQDNVKPHTSDAVKEHFEEKRWNILQWPLRSPYLNIIEQWPPVTLPSEVFFNQMLKSVRKSILRICFVGFTIGCRRDT